MKKKQIKKIDFKNENIRGSHFDIMKLKDVIAKKPSDHSQFEFHRLTFYVILLFTSGKGKHNINFEDYEFEKGSIMTIRENNIHKFYKSNANGVLLIFTKQFIFNHSNKFEASKILLLFNELLTTPKLQLSQSEYDEITTLINQANDEYLKVQDTHSPIIVRSLFQIILTKLFRLKSKDNISFQNNKYLPMFLDFQNLVEKHCFETRKVIFFADKMGITTKTLNNITKGIIHKSAKTFINDTFIVQTKRLIINKQHTLSEIAYKVGFDEPSNFFKYFKKYAGVSPSSFRASLTE